MALIEAVTLIVPLLFVRPRIQTLEVRKLFDRDAWQELPYCLWAGYLFVSLLGLYVPAYYVQLYGHNYVSSSLAGYLLPIFNAGSFFGRLVRDTLSF